MPGAAQVGQLIINMVADIASLKTSLAEGNRATKTAADKMAADLAGIKSGFESAIAPLQNLTVKVGTLDANLARAQSTALSLGKGLILGAAAGMSIDAITKKITGVIDGLATLKTVSEKTGSSVENLSKLSFAAKQSGSDLDSVAGALAKMSKGMSGADNDTKGAGQALAFLGIKAKDTAGNLKDPAEMFAEVAKKLDGYQDGAGKAAIAQALFGKAGADMLPTLKLLGEQGDVAAKATDAQATAARQYQRDLAKLDAQKGALFKTIATALLPTMSDFTNAMLDASKNTNIANKAAKDLQGDGSITDWADSAAMGLARLIDVIVFIPKALKAVAGSFKVVGADMKFALTSAYLASPIGLGRTLGSGKNPLTEFKAALDERNKTLADANAQYVDLWNYNGAAMEQAMQKRIAARKSGDGTKPESAKAKLNFSTTSDEDKASAGAALGRDISAAQAALESERTLYESRQKMLDVWHSKLGMSDADFYDGRETARKEYMASEAAAFEKEKGLATAAQSAAGGDEKAVTAAKDKYAQLVNAHQKFVEDMRKAAGEDQANSMADGLKLYMDTMKAISTAGDAEVKSLDDAIAKQREHNAEIGKTKEQVELARQAQVEAGTVDMKREADAIDALLNQADLQNVLIGSDRDLYAARLAYLNIEIDKRHTLAGLNADGAVAEAGAKAAADLDKYLNPDKAEAFGNSLKGAFNGAADSLSKLTDVLTKYGSQQAANEDARAKAEIKRRASADGEAQYLRDIDAINSRNTKQQLASYGDMAGAAASFFGEHSRGYQTLTTVSQVFHAAELAMTLAETVPKAINAVLTQGSGDPYTAFARMAAMGALVAGLGVAIGGIGGGADTTAKDRQAAQGSGSVLGDSSAKSDSLSKSIELTAANSSTQINYLSGLLTTLKGIQTDIKSFAAELVQSTDISNPDAHLNTNNGLASTVGAAGLAAGGAALGGMAGAGLTAFTAAGAVGGPIGMVVGSVAGAILSKIPAVGKLMTSIFGGKQSVEDSGFTLGKTTVGTALDSGIQGLSYADIKTSGGWFSKDHTDTKDTALGADANQQFTQIISSIADSITQAGALVGVSGDDFTKQLNSFVIDIGKVSLKGMTGDEIEKTLESVFSKLGDQMAQAAIPDLTQFQQVGEGYLETLVRVSSDYAKVDASLTSIGKTFGSVGVASIGAREDLISLMGGIDDFQSKTADFDSNFLTKAQQLAPVAAYVTTTLQGMNLGWVQTREQLAGVVGGLDLTSQSGRDTYAALMNLESAFAATHAAIVDTTMSEQDIADQRKDLQDKVDGLLMTSEQLRAKELLTIDASNAALYNQAAAAQSAKDALDLQAQIYEATGDKAGAAAVLLAQHQAALAQTDPALRALTQQLWDVQSAATAAGTAKSDASALLSNVDAAYSTLDTVIQREKDALQKRIDTENDVVTKLTSLGSSIKSALSSFDVTDDPAADRKAAQATLGSSLALMQSGAMLSDDQTTALQDALTTATKDSKGQFGSYEDYMFDMLKTQRQIAQLGDVTKDQKTTEQKQLDQMKAQSTALDDQLAAAKQQVDLLKGIDTSTTTLAQAMSALQLSLAGAKANPLVSATPAITQAYQDSLGRAPDATGLAYWQNQVAGGTSTPDVVSAIKTSKEAQSQIEKLYQTLLGRPADSAGLDFFLHSGASLADMDAAIKSSTEYKAKIPGFALGGDFAGGLRIVGENGPELEATGPARIFNAHQTSGMLSRLGAAPVDNTALLAAAFSKMQDTMEKLRAETRATAVHSAKTAGLLKRVIRNDKLITAPDPADATV
jgi:hypothetical protein